MECQTDDLNLHLYFRGRISRVSLSSRDAAAIQEWKQQISQLQPPPARVLIIEEIRRRHDELVVVQGMIVHGTVIFFLILFVSSPLIVLLLFREQFVLISTWFVVLLCSFLASISLVVLYRDSSLSVLCEKSDPFDILIEKACNRPCALDILSHC